MFDDYSLRLLGEIGIEVYLPRGAAPVAAPDAGERDGAVSPAASSAVPVPVLIEAAARDAAPGMVDQVLRALRSVGLDAAPHGFGAHPPLESVRGAVVLGNALMRQIGADLSAQQQARIVWVVAASPTALRGDAAAKRALWSEIRRLARALSAG